MKARDIEGILKQRGFERGTLHVLVALSEQITQTRKDLTELAGMFDMLTNNMQGMLAVAGRMKEVIEKRTQEDDGQDPATQLLGRN